MVRATGLEPAHRRYKILNLTRLPISPHPRCGRGEISSHTPAIQARRNFFAHARVVGMVKFLRTHPRFRRGEIIADTRPFLILSFFRAFVKLFRKRRKATPHKCADCTLCGIALREGFRVKALPQRFIPFYFFFFRGRLLPWHNARNYSRTTISRAAYHESARRQSVPQPRPVPRRSARLADTLQPKST